MPDERPSRRAAVVCRHPMTLRAVTQALGAAGLGLRQAIAPGMLPRSQRGEFEAVLLDLDVDGASPPATLVQSVTAACPDTPILCIAGVAAKQRLIESLSHRAVTAVVPKLGSWLDTMAATALMDGPDEQELSVAMRRLSAPAPVAVGPAPYLAGNTPIEERLIASLPEKDEALQAVLQLGQRLGLSDEKLRRVEVCADELTMNALNDAPKTAHTTAPAGTQVRLRFGSDGRTLAISVHDRFGSITRDAVAAHIGRVLEPGGPRPRPAVGPQGNDNVTGGAGLGLVLTFGAANQLIVQSMSGKFTEVTAAIHIAGSNKAALARGSALYMYL